MGNEKNISPIDLLRMLFVFGPTLDDYQVVVMVFEDYTKKKCALEILEKMDADEELS